MPRDLDRVFVDGRFARLGRAAGVGLLSGTACNKGRHCKLPAAAAACNQLMHPLPILYDVHPFVCGAQNGSQVEHRFDPDSLALLQWMDGWDLVSDGPAGTVHTAPHSCLCKVHMPSSLFARNAGRAVLMARCTGRADESRKPADLVTVAYLRSSRVSLDQLATKVRSERMMAAAPISASPGVRGWKWRPSPLFFCPNRRERLPLLTAVAAGHQLTWYGTRDTRPRRTPAAPPPSPASIERV
ncbi:hypothetical protein JDV02_004549 [Purpureocillium takamizusanense]|uniref:Uncharacterized protein n=1 Tax=Purpureocillium takamizusanense TaxID=2060973 RepID=A0A9Q8VAZ0_9HYPO|nr:uncharacterized protein JDV02_004549 [Purpureocillium takamizusanense]UNI18272.1 hypothetical protein JDV02_004549 [Purpureocillium takamizusanense]